MFYRNVLIRSVMSEQSACIHGLAIDDEINVSRSPLHPALSRATAPSETLVRVLGYAWPVSPVTGVTETTANHHKSYSRHH